MRRINETGPTPAPFDWDAEVARRLSHRVCDWIEVTQLPRAFLISIPIGIEVCKFGLGWDTQCDLDASCIGLRADYGDAFICYFGNKDPIAGVVTSSGDNMSGNMWS